MRTVGRGLLVAAVLIVLFVAYQLWGTGLAQSRAQHTLRRQFEVSTAARRTAVGGGARRARRRPSPGGASRRRPDHPEDRRRPGRGGGGRRRPTAPGPGHYPGTPLPGQAGNAAIAGHRTTYGGPFYDLNELVAGDLITVTTVQGAFRYAVVDSEVVDPTDGSVLDRTPVPELTLTTCTPWYSAARRLVVVAPAASPVVTAAGSDHGPPAGPRPCSGPTR